MREYDTFLVGVGLHQGYALRLELLFIRLLIDNQMKDFQVEVP